MMRSLNFLLCTSLLSMGQQAEAWDNQIDRPNILVILIDDAGYSDFGFMGSSEIRTPYIDALASEGCVTLHEI